VVFYGTLDGWFKALDAKNGKLLWQKRLDSGIIGQPVAYKGPDGHEYVAILAGVGGWIGAVLSNKLDVRDSTAANGMATAVPDLPLRSKTGGKLYVFRLP
jgi:outer membrane protein assembly factor BamB